jgi:cytochrome c oxidase assembly protein subunit 20
MDHSADEKRISVKDDLSHIGDFPCARSSLLYGIGGGSAIGAVRYIGSRSMSPFSSHL